MFTALVSSCSAFIIPDDLDASDVEAGPSLEAGEDETATESGSPPSHPLDGSEVIDCAGAEAVDNCSWEIESTNIDCELNCQLPSPCTSLEVEYDLNSMSYVEPINSSSLACILDAFVATSPAYLEWTQRGVGDNSSSHTVYRVWILRPGEAVMATWLESSIEGNIGDYGQTLAATNFDDLQIVDCINETEGSDRYACLMQELLTSGCTGFDLASCE